METLLSIAIALCAGLLVSRFVKPLKLPAVTGYLIAGILIGPYCLGKLGVQGLGFPTNGDVKALSLFNDVALGFIAFAIGNEFRLSQLRHTGKQATVIGIFQALTATLMVDLVLIGLHFFVLGDLDVHGGCDCAGRDCDGDRPGGDADGRPPVQGEGRIDRPAAADRRAGRRGRSDRVRDQLRRGEGDQLRPLRHDEHPR